MRLRLKEIRKSARLLWHVAAAAMMSLPATTSFADANFKYSGTIGYERGAQIVGGVSAEEMAFEMTPYAMFEGVTKRQLQNGELSLKFGVRTTANATAHGDALAQSGLSLTYQQKYGTNDAWRIRLKGDVDRSVSQAHWVFQRQRFTTDLKYRHSGYHTTAATARFGYRNQNEVNFEGFDQEEYLLSATHTWSPKKDRLSFGGTLYSDRREADTDRFSYREVGVRLTARVPLNEETELRGKAVTYQRIYDGIFSSDFEFGREDTRVSTSIQLRRKVSDRLTLQSHIGWDSNRSNIPVRDYSGAEIGVSAQYTFN